MCSCNFVGAHMECTETDSSGGLKNVNRHEHYQFSLLEGSFRYLTTTFSLVDLQAPVTFMAKWNDCHIVKVMHSCVFMRCPFCDTI